MEIGIIAYVLYASTVLIWCSLNDDWANVRVVSPGLLRQWLASRSDVIVFELHPDGPPSREHPCEDFLSVTPSSLMALTEWIPPDSTLVVWNRGVSPRTVQQTQKLFAARYALRVFWLDETAQGMGTHLCRADMVAPRPAQ